MEKAEDAELAASRRPLASRKWGWTNRFAARLVAMGVAPNHISLFSIACAALAAAALVGTRYAASPGLDALLYLLAIVGIQGRLLCNLFDGMVAVEGGRRSAVGELYNETPDRVADTLILVAAGYAADPVYGPTLGWLAALLAMATAYVRVLGKAAGAGTYFIGPMAKQQRMAVVTFACGLNIATCLNIFVFSEWPDRVHDVNGNPGTSWMTSEVAQRRFTGEALSFWLAIICLGCIPTLWRRISRIAADLRAKAVS
jgi:phosphatidylglycerophosphate synthase